jgi:hypothetical protein
MNICEQCDAALPDDVSACSNCSPIVNPMGDEEDDFSLPSGLLQDVSGGGGRHKIWKVWSIIIVCLGLVVGSISSFFLFSASHLPDSVPHPIATGTVKPQALSVTPMLLNFGEVEVGTKAVLAVSIANHGSQALNWSIDTGQLAWLAVMTRTGTLAPTDAPQLVYTTADTKKLAVGSYLDVEHVHSNVGNADVSVKITVIPAGAKKTANIRITPDTLDFGGLLQGQRAKETTIIGNTGRDDLRWTVNTGGNPGWLTLDPGSGIVRAGDVPQALSVTVDATTLPLGNYSTTLTVTSNGGNVDVGVRFSVQSSHAHGSGTPAPSLSPNSTSSIALVGATATALSTVVTSSSTAVLSANAPSPMATTIASVTSKTTPSVPALTVTSTVTAISAGPSVTVTTVPPRITTTTTSTATSTPTATATATPSPTPTPIPNLRVSPTSLSPQDPQVCLHEKDGTYTCTVTISEDVPASLHWQMTSTIVASYEVSGAQGPQQNIQYGMLTRDGMSAEFRILGLTCSNPGEFDFSSDATNTVPIIVQWACPAGHAG